MWTIVDAIGNLLGPLWPDNLDNVLDAITSVPDMVQECGVGCATSQVLAVILYPLFQSNTIDCATPMVAWLLGMCE